MTEIPLHICLAVEILVSCLLDTARNSRFTPRCDSALFDPQTHIRPRPRGGLRYLQVGSLAFKISVLDLRKACHGNRILLFNLMTKQQPSLHEPRLVRWVCSLKTHRQLVCLPLPFSHHCSD